MTLSGGQGLYTKFVVKLSLHPFGPARCECACEWVHAAPNVTVRENVN